MPGKAVRCAGCSTFQNWRRIIPTSQVTLALILSIISVMSAVVPPVLRYYSNHSETYVRVLGPGKFKGDNREEDLTIRALVLNNGKRASFVKSASLTFDNTIHAEATDLEVKNTDDALVAPEKSAILHFSAPSVGRRGQKRKQEVLDEILAGGKVTIKVTVEETDRNGKLFDAFPAHRLRADKIYNWMAHRVASD